MRHPKAIIRLLLAPVVTALLFLLLLAGIPFIMLLRRPVEPWRNYCVKAWGRIFLKLMGVELNVEGTPPKPPFFLVSNHLSYLDIPVYFSTVRCVFVAKKEVRSMPLIGLITRTIGIIFIDRERKSDLFRANRQIASGMNRYQGILLFPEGTTSSGERILPFRPPLLKHPADADMPVQYASIRYETGVHDPPPNESVCWSGDQTLLNNFYQMAGNKKVICTLRFGEKSIHEGDRKKLAEKLQVEVEKQYSSTGTF